MALAGRVALVTGSTGGLGLGIARQLVAQGASIVLNGFGDPAAIRSLQDDMKSKYKVDVTYSAADMTQPAAIEKLFKEEIPAFTGGKGVDILVNNAGIQHVASIVDQPLEMWEKIMAINLTAPFITTKLALPFMLEQGFGRIINIASVHGLVASAGKGPYVASKHGILGLTKVTALETAGSGVTCNAICPGWVHTELVQKQIEARAQAKGISLEAAQDDLLAEKQPSKQFATADDIGQLAVFLCSPAAQQMTGAQLPVDGGWTSQ